MTAAIKVTIRFIQDLTVDFRCHWQKLFHAYTPTTPKPGLVKSLTVARDLQRRRARERTSLFTAEGVRCVEELLAAPRSKQPCARRPPVTDSASMKRLTPSWPLRRVQIHHRASS